MGFFVFKNAKYAIAIASMTFSLTALSQASDKLCSPTPKPELAKMTLH
jgi:hypothetical protein